MAMDPEDKLIATIKNNIEKNGFPEKCVSLPWDKIQAAAQKLGLDDLEMLLSRLEYEDIYHQIQGNKIFFASEEEAFTPAPAAQASNANTAMPNMDQMGDMFGGINPDDFKGMGKMDMMKKAAEMMKGMSPDQLDNIKKMYDNMSPEERDNIMNQAKDMGV